MTDISKQTIYQKNQSAHIQKWQNVTFIICFQTSTEPVQICEAQQCLSWPSFFLQNLAYTALKKKKRKKWEKKEPALIKVIAEAANVPIISDLYIDKLHALNEFFICPSLPSFLRQSHAKSCTHSCT